MIASAFHRASRARAGMMFDVPYMNRGIIQAMRIERLTRPASEDASSL